MFLAVNFRKFLKNRNVKARETPAALRKEKIPNPSYSRRSPPSSLSNLTRTLTLILSGRLYIFNQVTVSWSSFRRSKLEHIFFKIMLNTITYQIHASFFRKFAWKKIHASFFKKFASKIHPSFPREFFHAKNTPELSQPRFSLIVTFSFSKNGTIREHLRLQWSFSRIF